MKFWFYSIKMLNILLNTFCGGISDIQSSLSAIFHWGFVTLKFLVFYRNLLINWVFLSWRQVQRVPPMWNKHLWPWQLKSRGEWVHLHLLLMHLGKERSLIQVHLLRRKVVVVVKSFFKKNIHEFSGLHSFFNSWWNSGTLASVHRR